MIVARSLRCLAFAALLVALAACAPAPVRTSADASLLAAQAMHDAALAAEPDWRLQGGPAEARLDGLDGGPLAGPDARELLAAATGWDIPVQALAHWVRGGRAPGQAHIEFGPDGLPALIVQQGWSVEYRGWTPGPVPRPQRVFATRDDASVRLAVDAWEAP